MRFGRVRFFSVSNSQPTTITNFVNGIEGQEVTLQFNDANTTINRTSAFLAGSANIVSTNRGTCKLVKHSTAWYEVCRDLTNG